MSYRCQICGVATPPGMLLLRHVIRRANGQIEREVSVCTGCHTDLSNGKPYAQVRAVRSPNVPQTGPEDRRLSPPIKPVLFPKKPKPY